MCIFASEYMRQRRFLKIKMFMKSMIIHKVWVDDVAVYAETEEGLVASD